MVSGGCNYRGWYRLKNGQRRPRRLADRPGRRRPSYPVRAREAAFEITTWRGAVAYAIAEGEVYERPPRRPKGYPRKRWRRALKRYAAERDSDQGERRCRGHRLWVDAVDRWMERIQRPPVTAEDEARVRSRQPPLRLRAALPTHIIEGVRPSMEQTPEHLLQIVELARALGVGGQMLVWLRWSGVVWGYGSLDWARWRRWETGEEPIDSAVLLAELRRNIVYDDIPF